MPDNSFIRAAHILGNPRAAIATTNTRQGDLALKIEAMKQAKSNVFDAKKDATLQAAKKKAAEAIAKKEDAARNRALEAGKRRLAAAEKKVVDAEKKAAEAEAKRQAAAEKRAAI